MIFGLPMESFILMAVLPAIVVAAMFVSSARMNSDEENRNEERDA